MSKIAYISGHLNITRDEFNVHYAPKIEEAIHKGHAFVVGDARGADLMSQQYLYNRHFLNAKVYHMFDAPRNNMGFQTVGGFDSDDSRDVAMTLASDYDIAWVRKGRDKSGTAKNIQRRKELNSLEQVK